ncbi:MAG: hypothetical protein JXA07_05990 [Spirochaetes bacterium]|nr:hypothetical protein [Spirochaetota bacterium]
MMKKILLFASKNSEYRAALEKIGYSVTACAPGATAPEEIGSLPSYDMVIADAADCVEGDGILYRILREKGSVVCLADAITKELKHRIIDCGIADVLVKCDAESLAALVPVIGHVRGGDAGMFVVLDDEAATREIVGSIVTRFNYHAVCIDTVDELFDGVIGPATRFILVNLGMRTLDLNGLVRKFYASVPARSVPVLAYKDMREGVFVHELVSGLNRLTRYILGTDELYGLLVDMLFRRELVPLVAQLNGESQGEENSAFGAETLNQVFYACEKRLFERTDLFGGDTLLSMARTLHELNLTLQRVESLKWLKTDIDPNGVSTAEREG